MTKKHFIHAANLVQSIATPRLSGEEVEVSTESLGNLNARDVRAMWTAEAFVSLFREYNPRFNEQKFLQACGLVEQPAKRSRKVRSNDDSPAPLSPDGRYMS